MARKPIEIYILLVIDKENAGDGPNAVLVTRDREEALMAWAAKLRAEEPEELGDLVSLAEGAVDHGLLREAYRRLADASDWLMGEDGPEYRLLVELLN